ncbi:MAG: glycoside hydrolase family 9 protein [Oscillospiraceae bacterium]|nr:glycoside hydrolase family 9 protein [Oscillospiraceae bacterium]
MPTKRNTVKRFITSILTSVILFTLAPVFNLSGLAANVEEQPGLQLQTILIDNGGSGVWTTESWGGANLVPNMNWTTLALRDYYANGVLNFEVRNTAAGNKNFTIGLKSNRHGEQNTIDWTNKTAGKALTATPDWESFTLSIKAVVDDNSNGGFSLDDFWYVAVSGVNGGKLEFRNVSISSSDDERQYPMIKVNQVGYELTGPKTARVSYFPKFGSLNGKTFEVVNEATGDVAFSGKLPNESSTDADSGEIVHVFSFDSVNVAGKYFIRIPDAGLDSTKLSPRDVYEGVKVDTIESVKFKIDENVYSSLLTDLVKYYYFQRQGIALDEKYAGDFAREDLHPNDIAVKKWSDRDNLDAVTYDVSQGWYDAGDYGKYLSSGASSVSDLLFAYELFPDVFNSLNLNIPETDPNNARYADAPGILSEIKWELDMILKFEHNPKDGSFFVAANYADNTIYMEDTLNRDSNYKSTDDQKDLRSHQATASAAAVLAHAYIIYKDIPAYAGFAKTCLDTAIRAWDWVTDPANPKNMKIDAANRTYTFSQEDLDREMFWAAGSIYRAVKLSGGDPGIYDTYIQNNYTNENVLRCFDPYQSLSYNHGGKSFLGFVQYLYGNNDANADVKNQFDSFDTWRSIILNTDTWGTAFPQWGYWWGSNQVIAQGSMSLLLGSIITEGKDKIPSEVLDNLDNTVNHLLGINPMSFSYVSGNGEKSVMNIFSGIYSRDKKLTPYKIPAGYFTEGCNIYDNRHLSKFDGKCYIDSDGEWTTNENTLYGNGAMTFLMASVMAENKLHPLKQVAESAATAAVPADAATTVKTDTESTILSADSAADSTTAVNTNANNDSGSGISTQTLVIIIAVILVVAIIAVMVVTLRNKNKKNSASK